MTTATSTPSAIPVTLDVSGTPAVPLSRLVKVELRKMVDTRAGFWLVMTMALITLAAMVIFTIAGERGDLTFGNYMGFAATPQALLLPVLGILLVTGEWTQRTAMVTFTLSPHRGTVVLAKVLAALVLGALAIVLAIGLAAVAALMFGPEGAFDGFEAHFMGKFGLLQATAVLQGLAFGLLLLNSATAIVAYFVVPSIISVVTSVWESLQDAAPWFDLATAQTPLFDSADITGEQWAQLATSSVIWLLVPFAFGVWRVLRAEVK